MLTETQSEKIVTSIKELTGVWNLDLRDYYVATECASGPYFSTPLLALAAGASSVLAFGRDSAYGKFEDIQNTLCHLVQRAGLPADRLNVTDSLQELKEFMVQSDIVTNSGYIRPLNIEKLQSAREGLVIPLMYESWKLRKTDIDIEYCRRHGVRVVGLNERHPLVGSFDVLGQAVRRVLDASHKVSKGCKVLIVCDNDLYGYIEKNLLEAGAVCERYPAKKKGFVPQVVVFAHTPRICGGKLEIDYEKLPVEVESCVQLLGDVDRKKIKGEWIPAIEPRPGHMGLDMGNISWDGVMRLQAAGLKSAELALNNEIDFNGHPLCQPVV